jgi:flagellar hook-associated protein 3 FlgL
MATATSNDAGTSPFSTTLSQPAAALEALKDRVPVGEGRSVQVGILASANSDATSTGAATTGAHMRDILRALATLGALSSDQMGDPAFAELVADTRTGLEGAISALAVDAGVLGNRQAALAEADTRLGETATVLQGQVANVEDVDMADVLSRLSLTQTQLQASYQLLGGLQSLSLTNFLAIG